MDVVLAVRRAHGKGVGLALVRRSRQDFCEQGFEICLHRAPCTGNPSGIPEKCGFCGGLKINALAADFPVTVADGVMAAASADLFDGGVRLGWCLRRF